MELSLPSTPPALASGAIPGGTQPRSASPVCLQGTLIKPDLRAINLGLMLSKSFPPGDLAGAVDGAAVCLD